MEGGNVFAYFGETLQGYLKTTCWVAGENIESDRDDQKKRLELANSLYSLF